MTRNRSLGVQLLVTAFFSCLVAGSVLSDSQTAPAFPGSDELLTQVIPAPKYLMTRRPALALPNVTPVRLNLAVLKKAPAFLRTYVGGEIVAIDRVASESRGTAVSWFGRVQGRPESTAVFTLVDNVLFGRVDGLETSYSLQPFNGGYAWIDRAGVPVGRLENDTLIPPITQTVEGTAEAPPVEQAPDDGGQIDLLVVYSQQLSDFYGTALPALIQSYVDVANAAYVNSGIGTRLRLVHSQLYDRAELRESINACTAVGTLQTDSTVAGLRNTFGADLVAMLRLFQASACGCGYLMTSASPGFAGWGFSVVEVRTVVDANPWYCQDTTLAHELGHNMGCQHDRDHADGPGVYSYSYGYDEPGVFATIMSYDQPRITYFSTPSVLFGGTTPIGVPEGQPDSADNARTINNTRTVVAQFRAEQVVNPPGSTGPSHGVDVSSTLPIIVERAEYTDAYSGADLIYNAVGNNSVGQTSGSLRWYFPDVNTTKYAVHLQVLNISPVTASVTIRYFRGGNSEFTQQFTLGPGLPRSVDLTQIPNLAGKDLSAVVESDVPVVAEKSFTWSGTLHGNPVDTIGGAGTAGAPQALTQWYLAEGSTAGWKLWYMAFNPSPTPSTVTFDYLLEGANFVSETFVLPPMGKRTVYVNDLLPFANVSLRAQSNVPIVVERIMHWNANVAGEEVNNIGGHCAMGVAQPETIWYLAEGSTAGWKLWVLLMNPNSVPVQAYVTWMREGAPPILQVYNLPPNSRTTIEAKLVPGLEFANISVKVQSSLPIIAERAMYWDTLMPYDLIYNTDGHNSPGVNGFANRWYTIASSHDYRTWVLFMNPNSQATTVTMKVTAEDGAIVIRQYSVPGNSRLTVQLNYVW